MNDYCPPLANSILDVFRATPLVRLDRLTQGMDGAIVAKLDCLLPGGSKKDRAAKALVEGAIQAGDLAPGQPVVSLTSGNFGTGLAIACTILGHPFIAAMSAGNSPERVRMMTAFGAEVVLAEQVDGTPGNVTGADLEAVEREVERIVAERGAFNADQFVHEGSVLAHKLGTGPELLAQTDGKIDAFVDFIGSGGTFAGVSQVLKAHNREIKCYAVEPEGSPVLAGRPVSDPRHKIQGGGYAIEDLPLLDGVEPDGFLTVTSEEAMLCARRLAREEGIFGGFSAGANVAAALKLLEGKHAGQLIGCVVCDSGMKYLSTDLWA